VYALAGSPIVGFCALTYRSFTLVMFKSYDTANRGHLTREEVYKMIKASFAARGEKVADKDVLQAVEDTFEEIDSDHDNRLSFDEFKQAVYSNKLMINCSVHFSSTPGAHVPQQ